MARGILIFMRAMAKSREMDLDKRYKDQTDKVFALVNGLCMIGFENIPAPPGGETFKGG